MITAKKAILGLKKKNLCCVHIIPASSLVTNYILGDIAKFVHKFTYFNFPVILFNHSPDFCPVIS